jgi:FtsH-binding integral membrane protein
VEQPTIYSAEPTVKAHSSFLPRVYSWMTAGLALTALVALFTVSSRPMLQMIFGHRMVFYGLIIAELGLVIALVGAVRRLSATAATGLFLLYSALSGVTFASIFLVYTSSSVASTFFVSAGTFGAMSLYGYTTKRDLTSWGSFLFMGLIGFIIASVVNIWLQSAMITWITTYIGIFIFVGLTAYDTQKIKRLAYSGLTGEAQQKAAILGALSLYLDFVNLFLLLLQVFGRRR